MKVKINSSKSKTSDASKTMEISERIFKVDLNHQLILQERNRLLANRHRGTSATKNRGQVSGGGRKPFRQKGTGNARAGSTRSPLWRGGGVTFGPTTSKNYRQRITQKMTQKAIFMILSEKLKNSQLIVVENLVMAKIGTKLMQDFLEKLPIKEGKILVVLSQTNVNLELSARNLPYIKVIQVNNLNILDLLKYDYLVIDKSTINVLEKQFGEQK